MIYTLTTNPAIDMMMCSDELKRSVVTRTRDAVYTPNGKGLNVSFTLQHFGVASTVLGFFGGFSGEYIVDGCRDRGTAVSPVWVEDTTRINVFLNDGIGEYKLVGAGSVIPREKQDELLELLRTMDDPEYLCISGSLPRGIDPSYYDEILHVCAARGTQVVLDISSPKLKELLGYRPLLIKPNDEELRDVFGLETETEAQIIEALKTVHRLGSQNVLLTLGARGSYFYDGDTVWNCDAYPVKLLSSVCAGDACLGAFLSVWLHDRTAVDEALKRGAAAGANTAESPSLGDFSVVPAYMKALTVRRVEE